MKRSDIRKIIKEELVRELKALNEAFADPIASKLNKMSGMDNRWKNFWRSSAKTYNIAWDKVPKGSFRKVSTSDFAAIKKGMAFWIATSPKQLPGTRYSWDAVKPGVVAVTIDGKIQYFGGSGGIGSKGAMSARRLGDPVGQGKRGTLQLKKLPDYSDFVYMFDLESFRGGTKELKAKRAELKLGKDEFKDHKMYKRANLDRYKTMLADKVNSRDAVAKMVGGIVKMANGAVEEAMTVVKSNEYGDIVTTLAGNEVKLETVTRHMNSALDAFARFVRSENTEAKFIKKYPEYAADRDSFETGNMKNMALEIKSLYNQFKKGKFRYN
jgi:hypothetical protein